MGIECLKWFHILFAYMSKRYLMTGIIAQFNKDSTMILIFLFR